MKKAIKVLEKVNEEITTKIQENQELADSLENWQIKKAAITQKNEWIIRQRQTNYLIWRLKNESTE